MVGGHEYGISLAAFLYSIFDAVSFQDRRFLLKRYGWYRTWILSIYTVATVLAVVAWLTNSVWWGMVSMLHSTFAYKGFTKQIAALKAEHHIPQELED
jgi:hypothetical protein